MSVETTETHLDPSLVLRSYGRLAGWLADKIQVNFKSLKFVVDQIFEIFATFNKVTALLL